MTTIMRDLAITGWALLAIACGSSRPGPAAPSDGGGGPVRAGGGGGGADGGTGTGASPTVAGCPVFGDGNPWTRDVRGDPVDDNSDAYIGYIGSARNLHPDFGGTAADYY